MQYGEGNERRAREDAVRERTKMWTRWLAEEPDAAADLLLNLKHDWHPADIPRE